VAEIEGSVVGVAGYRILDDQNAKTTLMAVDPTCRGKGVGLMLQEARMNYLRRKGIRWLTTNCDDPAVIEWYRKHFHYELTGNTVCKEENFGLSHVPVWTTIRCAL
jgi:ribosomal protein S18 acetylase RimI-like enzyme